MPTYIVDATVSDRNTEMRPAALGWEVLETWHLNGTNFRRQRRVFEDLPSLAAVFTELMQMAARVYGDPTPAVTVQVAIRDVSFDLEESLPYRYAPTARGRRR